MLNTILNSPQGLIQSCSNLPWDKPATLCTDVGHQVIWPMSHSQAGTLSELKGNTSPCQSTVLWCVTWNSQSCSLSCKKHFTHKKPFIKSCSPSKCGSARRPSETQPQDKNLLGHRGNRLSYLEPGKCGANTAQCPCASYYCRQQPDQEWQPLYECHWKCQETVHKVWTTTFNEQSFLSCPIGAIFSK